MKKVWVVLLAAVVSIGGAGCSVIDKYSSINFVNNTSYTIEVDYAVNPDSAYDEYGVITLESGKSATVETFAEDDDHSHVDYTATCNGVSLQASRTVENSSEETVAFKNSDFGL